jgi:hypothetical protein
MKHIKILFILSTLFFHVTIQAQEGLVAHWSFDNLSGNQFINHVDGQPGGTVYGSQLVPGPVGNALSFDGVDDYARIPGNGMKPPSVLEDLSEGSISLWFRVDNIPTTFGIRPIFYYGRENACDFFDAANGGMIIEVGHSPIHNGSRRLYFTEWTNGCTYPSFCYDSWHAIEEGKWYHYVAIVGSNFNTGYLDGEEMNERRYNFGYTYTHEFFSDAVSKENLWIGRGYWDANDMFFDGAIDEIKIFDHALTQAEVEALYAEGEQVSIETKTDHDADIFIYPNPSKNKLKLELNNSEKKIFTFSIYSSDGILIKKFDIDGEEKSIDLDISDFPKGIYFYTLSHKNKILTSNKLVKL